MPSVPYTSEQDRTENSPGSSPQPTTRSTIISVDLTEVLHGTASTRIYQIWSIR
jgi:hypothetical protein